MLSTLFAAVHLGIWNVFGGHVTLATILALFIAVIVYQVTDRLLFSILLYYGLLFLFFIIGDMVFGPYHLGAIREFPHW